MTYTTAANITSVDNTVVIGTGPGFSTMGYSSTVARGDNIMSRDSDGNTAVNAIAIGTTSTATSGQTINLYIGSAPFQVATGTSTITYVLPQATTLTNGWYFNFINDSTGTSTIKTYGGSTLFTIAGSSAALVTLTDDTTSAGVWDTQWLGSPNSNSGYVWTNNSSTSSPSWQSISSIPGFFAPNTSVYLVDDFIGASPTDLGSIISSTYWQSTATSMEDSSCFGTQDGTSTNPGILQSFAASSSLVNVGLLMGYGGGGGGSATNYAPIALGGGALTVNFVAKLANLSITGTRYNFLVGLVDGAPTPTNGLYFTYSDNVNSGNFVINATAASTTTSTNTTMAPTTGAFQNFMIIVNSGGTNAQFYINGTSVGTISTNVPSIAVTPGINIERVSGTVSSGTLLFDLFYLSQTLTTAR